MKSLVLSGGELITPMEARFTSLWVVDGRVAAVGDDPPPNAGKAEKMDVSGCYVTPGLIDLQVNGGKDCNFWGDPSVDDVKRLCQHLLKAGVTSFLPTLITDNLEHLSKNIAFLESIGVGKNGSARGAVAPPDQFPVRMPGIHLEGPCLSEQRPGVHPPQWIVPLTMPVADKLAHDSVRLITLAPETEASGECVQYLLSKGIFLSLGHSNATFEEAQTAFERGIKLMTHTFNALPALHHRAPGAVTAALLDDEVTCCVIADGLHVDPVMIRLLVKAKGKDRVVLVTDVAQVGTTGGGLVGSSVDLNQCVTNVVKWGVASFADAIAMSTLNAARAAGLDEDVGALAPGMLADVVVWDKQTLAVKHVIVGGKVAI